VTDWAVAKRRIGKHVPTNPHPTIEGRPLLCNRPVSTHHSKDCATIERLFCMGSAPRSYLEMRPNKVFLCYPCTQWVCSGVEGDTYWMTDWMELRGGMGTW
jgi:hypothetical protein